MDENPIHRAQNPSVQASASTKLPKPDARRLRASCDGCYLSKVKCTKETPTCRRCSNHGVVCKYSPSQRVGKPRRRENQPAYGGSTSQETGAAGIANAPSTSDAAGHPPPYSWNINFVDPSITADSSRYSLDEISMIWQNSLSVTDSENGAFVDDSSRDSNLSSPSNSLPTPVDLLSEYPDNLQPSLAGLDRFGKSVRHQPPQPRFLDDPFPLQDPLPPLYFSSTPNSVGEERGVAVTDDCSCATTTFEILRTLQDQSSHTSFDRVLSVNKSAVSTISTILSCSCTRDSTSIMTLAAALTKIMSRYQSIGGASSLASGRSPTANAFKIAPAPIPITLGAYKLDGAEEEQVKLQVILSELRKVDGLMARFQERFCAGPVKHEARVYNEMVVFLRRRFRDIVEGLQRDLQTVYEASSL
ncbi:hypothetical protein MMC07_008056 [Pseudocyphellaria aurata]|nr:hypothetical protein [Pseudocyphellaria aurata]